MKKRYLVFNELEENVYDLVVEEIDDMISYKLYANKNEIWTEHFQGTEIISIIDEGDLEYKIRIEGEKIGGRLDVSQIDCLRLVLNFIDNKDYGGKNFYKLFEDIDTNYILL
jgi:uncharacterized secreted protein with C-terminal beta-propeller domain